MRILESYSRRDGFSDMATDFKLQKFWVDVGVTVNAKGQRRFTISLMQYYCRREPIHMEPFLFVSRRTFTSEYRAMLEAEWQFGALQWKRVVLGLRAGVDLGCRARYRK